MPPDGQLRLEEELKRAQALLAAEKRTLEMIAGGAPLTDILHDLCASIDEQAANAITTVLLMDADGRNLWTAAGPRMPPKWVAAISPLHIGPQSGSCGTAAFLKARVVTEDIASDPRWVNHREAAISNGIRASWSQPIIAKHGQVHGTFAMCFTETRGPGPTDLQLIEDASRIALIAIERSRAEEQRKQALQELQRKQDLLDLAQKAARAMAFDWYIQKEINYWSPEQEALYGLAPGTFDGRYDTWKQLVHPEDWPLVVESLKRAHVTGEIEAEYRVIWPDGTTHWHAANGQMLFDAEGKPFRMVGFTADVTRRKVVEQELRRSERYLAEAQRLTHTGSYAWSVATRKLVYWSDEVYRLWGFDREQGLPEFELFRERIHPEDREAAAEVLERTVREGVDNDILFRIVLPDGSMKYVHSVGHPVLNAAGEVVEVFGTNMDVTASIESQRALEAAYNEIAALKDQLQKENVALREEIDKSAMFEEIVGSSQPLRDVLSKLAKVATSESTVLILGETGTGKELIARAIHKRSNRSSRAFIRVNCAAIPQSLIASELFGHEKGAFTGALQRRIGRFESAHGGTIFLDEVGDLPTETQVALLRVLQEKEIERVGSSQSIRVDVRVLAATNRDLKNGVAAGSFREDLYYRLNVFPISVPPLRDRKEDVPMLVEYLIERYASQSGKKLRKISRKTMELFQNYSWPGNVRELQNVIERAVVLCESDTFSVDPTWLPAEKKLKAELVEPLAEKMAKDEREIIERALAAAKGRIAGPTGAASRLGMPRQTLEYKIKILGIDKHTFKAAAAGKK